MEITSKMIIKADGTTDQNIKIGTGIKTPHIQDGAVTESKLGDNSVTSAKIKDGNVGNAELANDSVTYEKLDSTTRGKLVTNGNTHDHSGGDGAQIRHSSLDKDDGRNPHGTTAADLGAATESYVNNFVNTKGYATKSYVDDKYNDNRGYINTKTAGTFSSTSNIENVTTSHTKQVNASYVSTSKGYLSQVNASINSKANGNLILILEILPLQEGLVVMLLFPIMVNILKT
jgi:hypothetical protein